MTRFFFVVSLFVLIIKVDIHALPMLNQEKSSHYKLLTQEQILAHKASELALASAATQNHENHVLQQRKPLQFHPMQSHHEKEKKKAITSFQSHLNNLDQLNMAERTGAIKLTKSQSGRKDIYTSISKEHYHQHNPETSSSTSNP